MTKEEATADVLGYIFDHELDDFLDNPSDNHVYFKALVVDAGYSYAKKFLDDRLKEIGE